MTPTQIKIAAAAALALLAWLLTKNESRDRKDAGRVTKEIIVEADVYSPNFGLTDSEIAARANPAVDPEMRRLIDVSNAVIAADDAAQKDSEQ